MTSFSKFRNLLIAYIATFMLVAVFGIQNNEGKNSLIILKAPLKSAQIPPMPCRLIFKTAGPAAHEKAPFYSNIHGSTHNHVYEPDGTLKKKYLLF